MPRRVDNMKELKVIIKYSNNSFQQTFSNLPIFSIFLISKIIRYFMFAFFLYSLFSGIAVLGGYTRPQILIFYLIFNLIDTTSQLLFREVYRFRALVVSGGLDLVLAKPMNPLIRCLLGGPDFIDTGMLILIVVACVYVTLTSIHPSLQSVLLFIAMLANALLISAAFHISVLALGIITFSVDHLIMIYRDLAALARIPIDLITNPLRTILTFVIPIGIMFTFPAKVLFGLLTWQTTLVSLIFGITSFYLSLRLWKYSLRQYQSAGS